MAVLYKPIKFFLNVCGIRIHSLEELREGENFHLDELYELFIEGILERWLDVHGYTAECEALSKLPKEPLDENSAKNFCKIMRPNDNISSLELIIQNFKLEREWKKSIKSLSIKEQSLDAVINAYHGGFHDIKQSIKDNSNNMLAVKASLAVLSQKYLKLFNMNQNSCLDFFKNEAPVALLLLLANPVLRAAVEQSGLFTSIVKNIKDMLPYKAIPCQSEDELDKFKLLKFVSHQEIKEMDNVISMVRITNKHTQSMWEDIEPNNKKFMILYADSSTTVRPYQNRNGELIQEDIDNFPIIEGIDYRSSNNMYYLVYMEI